MWCHEDSASQPRCFLSRELDFYWYFVGLLGQHCQSIGRIWANPLDTCQEGSPWRCAGLPLWNLWIWARPGLLLRSWCIWPQWSAGRQRLKRCRWSQSAWAWNLQSWMRETPSSGQCKTQCARCCDWKSLWSNTLCSSKHWWQPKKNRGKGKGKGAKGAKGSKGFGSSKGWAKADSGDSREGANGSDTLCLPASLSLGKIESRFLQGVSCACCKARPPLGMYGWEHLSQPPKVCSFAEYSPSSSRSTNGCIL